MYKIQIDQSLCSGFGTCAELAPEIFQLDGSTATVRRGESDDHVALEAASACPMAAISVSRLEAA